MQLKSLLLLVVLSSYFQVGNREKKFTLLGFIDGKNEGTVYLRYYKDGILFFDSSVIKSKQFSFSGTLAEPNLATLTYKSDPGSPRLELYTNFYLDPTPMKLTINVNNPSAARLTGSKTNTEYQLLKKLSDPLLNNMYRLQRAASSGNPISLFHNDSINIYKSQALTTLKKFINDHPKSNVSLNAMLLMIQTKELSFETALTHLRSLDPLVQKSSYWQKALQSYEKAINSSVGHAAPIFTRTDINGKNISLNDFKGKYILLEYWASWCAPCRELTPEVKEYYNKFHEKGLEIIYISCDSKYDAWKKAVADDKAEAFVHVLSFTDADMEFLKTHNNAIDASFKGELRKMYNLMPIPSEILINPAGKIIGRYRGSDGEPGEKLVEKLEEIFWH